MWTRMSSVVLGMGAILLGPALGTSEAHGGDGPRPDAVFYELTEEAVFRPDGFRDATSALEGKARPGSPLCPHGLQAYAKRFFPAAVAVKTTPRCRVVAIGRSVIDMKFGSGEISGTFWVVVHSVATNLTDAAELVVMTGSFTGHVQVRDLPTGRIIEILPGSVFKQEMALEGFPLPLPPNASFSFTGTFRLPFTVHHVAVYLTDRGELVPVLPEERALGEPTVRLEVNFE